MIKPSSFLTVLLRTDKKLAKGVKMAFAGALRLKIGTDLLLEQKLLRFFNLSSGFGLIKKIPFKFSLDKISFYYMNRDMSHTKVDFGKALL